jgi:hypothetical protein
MVLKPCSRSAVLRDSKRGSLLAHSANAYVSEMDRGRRRARCLHYFSPPRRRPSPAAPQPRPRSLFQRRHRAASLRPAAQASIAVNASLRTHIQHTHLHDECVHPVSRFRRQPSDTHAQTHTFTLSGSTARCSTHTRIHRYAHARRHTHAIHAPPLPLSPHP